MTNEGVPISLGHFCGSSVPPSITSSTNKVKVVFHGATSSRGFRLSYESVDRQGTLKFCQTQKHELVLLHTVHGLTIKTQQTTACGTISNPTEQEWVMGRGGGGGGGGGDVYAAHPFHLPLAVKSIIVPLHVPMQVNSAVEVSSLLPALHLVLKGSQQ